MRSCRLIWFLLLFFCAILECAIFVQSTKSLASMVLKKGPLKKISQTFVAPTSNNIDFTIIRSDCADKTVGINVMYSYSSGCIMKMVWGSGMSFYTQKEGVHRGNLVTAEESTDISVWIKDSEVKFQVPNQTVVPYPACPVENQQIPDEESGYLFKFSMWSLENLPCDIKLQFVSQYFVCNYVLMAAYNQAFDYKIYNESKAVAAHDKDKKVEEGGVNSLYIVIVSVAAGAILLGVLVAIFLWYWKTKNKKRKRPQGSEVPPKPKICDSHMEKPKNITKNIVAGEKAVVVADGSKLVGTVPHSKYTIDEDYTHELTTVDPHEGAPQPKRLTDEQFQSHAKKYMVLKRAAGQYRPRYPDEQKLENPVDYTDHRRQYVQINALKSEDNASDQPSTAVSKKSVDPTQNSDGNKQPTLGTTQNSGESEHLGICPTQNSDGSKVPIESEN